MSYVRHKSRAFRDAGDIPEVVRRRSEGRLKSYPSTEDARAWCDITDDRRQQILDYIISDIEQCSVGKYVPIDVIISTLLANKKSDCGKLQDEVDALKKKLEAYSKLEPKEEQKPMLDIQPRGVRRAADTVIAKTEETPDVCAAIKREQEGTSCAALDKYPDEDLKSLIIKKDAEIIALKNQLAAKQSELDQILAGKSMSGQPSHGFKEVEKERDNLKKELQASKHEIQSLKTRIDEPCVQEIEKLEKEIQRLKSKGQLTADEEAEIIRKEIDVLKKYCAKLATIQEENQALKIQVETLKKQPEVKPALAQRESLSSVATAVANMDIDTLRNELNNKIAKLNEVIAERDNLKEKIKQLEKELLKHQNLPDDIDTVRRKSEMLDSVSDECRKLRSSLESMKTVEQEMKTLKKRACKADKLQNDLDSVNKEIVSIRNKSAAEIQTLKSKNEEIVKERETYKKVAMEAKSMGEELKCLAHCAKEAEALKRERDCLKSKLQKLHGIEAQYRQLQHKVKYLENIQSEREMYKIKYEEMLGLECDCEMLKTQVDKFKDMDKDRSTLINQVRDCECCIAEQEEEIKKLIAHIDNMSKGNNEQQARLQREINNMKNELKQKNNVIATSEQQLSSVQEQLRKTIKGVSCETSCLRSRIAELQEQLSKKTNVETDKNDEDIVTQYEKAVLRIKALEKRINEYKADIERLTTENAALKQRQIAAMEGGAPVFDNDAFNKLKAQLENEQKKAMLAEAKLKEICEKQGISVPVIEVADVKRLSQAYEERLSQAKTEAELASSIKKQQDQEIKSLHSKYNDGLAKLQTSHEEVLKELDVEHAKELENLRSELRSSKETILTLERIMGSDKQSLISFKSSKKSAFEAASVKGSVRKTLSQKELSERGISERGSLNFEELKILHNKTCEATAALLHKCPTKHVAFTCGPLPNDEDRQRLIKRIAALENDLLKKQKHTQEKVGALQVAVRIERQRLQDFKNLLETEKNRNNELMCKIGAQSRTVANMQIERETMLKNSSFNEERLQSLVQHCEQKKRRIKKLEEDLAKQKAIHRKEMESLYNLQMRTPVPGSNNPTSRLCSSCSRRENKRRQSMDGEVDSHIPEVRLIKSIEFKQDVPN
ncbi:hypothetical protein RN001_007497 [Aquatica leii]|uniref:Uncharacterized protein n=1 Tax=Aquatica leii TaxID=1421715 RepID=A0AAN7PD71_9COLE|nr:hypothetical protein RN001_007497 [Aquatica leii]